VAAGPAEELQHAELHASSPLRGVEHPPEISSISGERRGDFRIPNKIKPLCSLRRDRREMAEPYVSYGYS
jgi:hypothetical protein